MPEQGADIIGTVAVAHTTAEGAKDEADLGTRRASLFSVRENGLDDKQEPRKQSVSATTLSQDHPNIAPTEEETRSLRRVAANLSILSFALCTVELAERASYYGAQNMYSNFVEFPLPAGGNGAGAPPRGTQETAGALNLGEQAANGLVLLFQFLSYTIPIFGGWWADVKIGRYRAVVYGVLICGAAHLIQTLGAIPTVLQKGPKHSVPPFMIGFVLLAFGAGVFKPNIAPTILDQNRNQVAYITTLKSGERVIVDPEATATRTMLLFYGFVNIGAFNMLPAAYMEKYVGYWLAYLEPAILYCLLPILLAAVYKRTYKAPCAGSSDMGKAFRLISMGLRRNSFRVWKKGFWDAVRPSVLAQSGVLVNWDDKFVDDVARTVEATEIFCYFPIWSLNDGGIGNVATNQGAAMTTNGAPNDVLNNINALTIILAVPILSYVVYPALTWRKIKFGRASRIVFGFFLACMSSVVGAILQWRVYKTSPCGYYASSCNIGTGVSPISIWWQIPIQVLGALSECFANVTAYELAYARSPPSMRGLVMALFLFNTAIAAAISEVLVPATVDPYLIWMWAAPGIALAIQMVLFWYKFRHLNNDEHMTERVQEASGIADTVVHGDVERLSDQDESVAEKGQLEKGVW